MSLPPTSLMHWTKIKTVGRNKPRPMRAHTMTLVNEKIFIFGGSDNETCFNDLYIFDCETYWWTLHKTKGLVPPPRPCRAHSANLIGDYIYYFGGGDGPNYFNTLYLLNTKTLCWEKPEVRGQIPNPRRAHTSWVYNDLLYIFAGGDGIHIMRSNDDDGISANPRLRYVWTKITTTGKAPSPRGYHTSTLVGNKVIVYGGSDGHECFSEIFILDLEMNHWSRVNTDRPVPRLSHTATQVGSYLFIIGGHDGNHYSHSLILLNLVTLRWEVRKIYGERPSSRGYHTAVLFDSRIFLFGGYDGHKIYNDMYVLDLSSSAYLPQITEFEIGGISE
ncbi:hypothetical protein PIROE2DRAFT_45847 [Piromyces sp. E2]|nr:hypothetical protein PIROE2DRAFT_45847 [Piromyces sp. E2]|eukprot:OUM60858.1 hypothetical protein PIROE2DRAFT_45847 [Piromyces sp. E2]